jgi:hypothetical protein
MCRRCRVQKDPAYAESSASESISGAGENMSRFLWHQNIFLDFAVKYANVKV